MKNKAISWWMVVVLVCAGLTGSSAQSLDSTAYTIAYNYYEKWDMGKAIYWFGQSIDTKYQLSKSYMYRGSAKSLIGNFAGAADDLNAAVKLDPANAEIYLHLARLRLFEKKYEEGIFCINQAIKIDSSDGHYFDCRALLLMNLFKFKEALGEANRAIKLDSNINFINNRGLIRKNMGNYKDAISDFEWALTMEPGDVTILTNIAICYSKLKNYEKALTICNDLLAKDPQSEFTLATRGEIFIAMGNKQMACDDFQTLFKGNPDLGRKYVDQYCH